MFIVFHMYSSELLSAFAPIQEHTISFQFPHKDFCWGIMRPLAYTLTHTIRICINHPLSSLKASHTQQRSLFGSFGPLRKGNPFQVCTSQNGVTVLVGRFGSVGRGRWSRESCCGCIGAEHSLSYADVIRVPRGKSSIYTYAGCLGVKFLKELCDDISRDVCRTLC